MKQLFLTKVKYTKQLENGAFKRVAEQYLFDGYTFTDCEANIYKHLGEIIRGEFIVEKIDKFNVDDVLNVSGVYCGKYFLVKQEYTNLDDAVIKERLLVNALVIDDAKKDVIIRNENCQTVRYEIKSIVETKILEYFQSETENLEA